jgi:hypothetical protein
LSASGVCRLVFRAESLGAWEDGNQAEKSVPAVDLRNRGSPAAAARQGDILGVEEAFPPAFRHPSVDRCLVKAPACQFLLDQVDGLRFHSVPIGRDAIEQVVGIGSSHFKHALLRIEIEHRSSSSPQSALWELLLYAARPRIC